jgi:hypothetical protein
VVYSYGIPCPDLDAAIQFRVGHSAKNLPW